MFEWLPRVRGHSRPFAYWFQKYTIDGWPEWETPAVDQTAMIPWGLERHYRRTGDADLAGRELADDRAGRGRLPAASRATRGCRGSRT